MLLYFVNISQDISGSAIELHKSETRPVVKFYIDFFKFSFM